MIAYNELADEDLRIK